MVWKVVNISDSGTSSKHGADDLDKVGKLFSGIDVDDVTINTDWFFKDEKMRIMDSVGDHSWRFSAEGDLSGDRWVDIPVITGDGKMVLSNFGNTFTDLQTIKRDNIDLLKLYRDTNVNTSDWDIDFNANNSGSIETNYVSLRASLTSNTSSSETGQFLIRTVLNGTMATRFAINELGQLEFGESGSTNGVLSDAGLSAERTFTFPNTSGQIGVLSAPIQTWTQENTFSKNTTNALLTLDHPNNTAAEYASKLSFTTRNSVNDTWECARITPYKSVTTDGDEESNLGLDLYDEGVFLNTHWFAPYSFGVINPNTSTWRYGATNNIRGTDKTQYYSNGTAYIPCFLDSNGSTSTIINNSAAEQTVYSNTTPQYSMNQNGFMEMTIHGYILQNQATGTVFTFRGKFGGVTMWQDDSISIGQNATKLPFTIRLKIYAKNSETAQGMAGQVMLNDGSAATTGIGDVGDDEGFLDGVFDSEGADGTRDTTASTQSFTLSAQSSVASSSVQLVRKHVSLLLVTAG